MDDPISWTIIGICLIGSFFFSCYETAIGCCNRFKIQLKADEGSLSAKTLLKICDKYDRAISTVLIGNNIVAVIISTLSTICFYHIFKNNLSLESYGLIEEYIPLISSIIMTFVVYILGDTLPKTIAKVIPDTISLLFVYPMYLCMLILTPISIIFEAFGKLIDKIFKVKDDSKFTEEDFENIVENVTDEGVLEEEQSEIIQSALDFVDTNVKEVLTPREKIFAVDINELDIDKLNNIIINTNYSRIPVYDKVFDNMIGILNIKKYLAVYIQNPHLSIRKNIQKPYFVSSRIMIDDLFNGFKKQHTHIALVRDNQKRIIGMVTMEDVLEELVEDISEPSLLKGKK